MLCRVALVRTNVSEELSASFIRVTRIGELGTTLAVTSNRRTLRIRAGNELRMVNLRAALAYLCITKAPVYRTRVEVFTLQSVSPE
jgi:hypothetical protein